MSHRKRTSITRLRLAEAPGIGRSIETGWNRGHQAERLCPSDERSIGSCRPRAREQLGSRVSSEEKREVQSGRNRERARVTRRGWRSSQTLEPSGPRTTPRSRVLIPILHVAGSGGCSPFCLVCADYVPFSTVILQRVLVSGLSISLSSFLFFPQSSLCAFFFFHVNSRMSLSICFQEHLEF